MSGLEFFVFDLVLMRPFFKFLMHLGGIKPGHEAFIPFIGRMQLQQYKQPQRRKLLPFHISDQSFSMMAMSSTISR